MNFIFDSMESFLVIFNRTFILKNDTSKNKVDHWRNHSVALSNWIVRTEVSYNPILSLDIKMIRDILIVKCKGTLSQTSNRVCLSERSYWSKFSYETLIEIPFLWLHRAIQFGPVYITDFSFEMNTRQASYVLCLPYITSSQHS